MSYNFDEIIPRQNTSSVKWDLDPSKDLLPMWVADMDFITAPEIIEALHQRVDHGVFGYSITDQAFDQAIVSWWRKRHDYGLDSSWIIPTLGVLPALSAIIRHLTIPGDKVLILTPVYNHFFTDIENCEREAVEVVLTEQNNQYTIDFEALEQKARDPLSKLLLISHPHNPVGRVWTQDELIKIGEIAIKNDVTVISDEIHSDLIYDRKHIPFASISNDFAEHSITCSSPSKTFNIAGVQVGYIFTQNESYRKGIQKIMDTQDTFMISPFGSTALVAAYTHGEAWLDALKDYLYENYCFLKQYLQDNAPQLKITPLEGTYLVWLDIRALDMSSEKLAAELKSKAGLWLNSGHLYGKAGEGFLRINIACPRQLLTEGLDRLIGYIQPML